MQEMETRFWSQVDPAMLKEVVKKYEVDLVLFEYSVREYFEGLGMGDYDGLKTIYETV